MYSLLLWRVDGDKDEEYYLYDIHDNKLMIRCRNHTYLVQNDIKRSLIAQQGIKKTRNFNIFRLDNGMPNIMYQGHMNCFTNHETQYVPPSTEATEETH